MYHKRSKGRVLVLENGTTKTGLVIDVLLYDSGNSYAVDKSTNVM